MVEKIDNFENKKAKEIDADDEALKKIRQLKLEGNFGIRTIGKELFYDFSLGQLGHFLKVPLPKFPNLFL